MIYYEIAVVVWTIILTAATYLFYRRDIIHLSNVKRRSIDMYKSFEIPYHVKKELAQMDPESRRTVMKYIDELRTLYDILDTQGAVIEDLRRHIEKKVDNS